ncbi:hypothetical protein D3C77_815270 [compost metagenome]
MFNVKGIANAEARETTPRIPAQPIMKGSLKPGVFSFFLILGLKSLGINAEA